MTVLRNGHVTRLTPAEAQKRAAQALATFRATVGQHSTSADSGNSGNSGDSGNSGNSGNSGTAGNSGTPTGIQVPAPAATWVVGCYVHGAPGHPPVTGTSGNSGNSGASGNS